MPPARTSRRPRASVFVRAGGSSRASRVAGLTLALLTCGCFYNDEGLPPPSNSMYYPTGLAVSPGGSALFIANSDFDLQYNGGTIQVIDIATLRNAILPMLDGVRCSEGAGASCAVAGISGWGTPCGSDAQCASFGLTCATAVGTCGQPIDICKTHVASLNGAANGQPCTAAGDCTSGFCGPSGTCAACSGTVDCYGANDPKCPGICDSGTCMLTCVSNDVLTPAACSPFSPPYVGHPQGVTSSVAIPATIGAFASGAVIATNPNGEGARLFIPVRGDPSITWFTIDDDRNGGAQTFTLDCGQTPSDTRCTDDHRIGVDPFDNFRDQTLPVEPVGLDISDDGTDIVTAHQIPNGPAVGLSTNSWSGGRPAFQFELTQGVLGSPSNVAHIPEPKVVTVAAALDPTSPFASYQQGFLLTYNLAADIDIFRVDPDALSSPPRPFLQFADRTPVTVNQTGTDSRGITVDRSERDACETACGNGAGAIPCLEACIATPLPVFVANRAPPSLLVGQITTAIAMSDLGDGTGSSVSDILSIYTNAAPLPQGPSNVSFGKVIAPDGSIKTMVFAVSFDTRRVSIYDPVAQTLISPEIATGRGPQSMAFDSCIENCPNGKTYALLYVGHFTDSYIGVVDLDMRHPESFGSMFASIGVPIPPVETQ